jgi:hypothetical protein
MPPLYPALSEYAQCDLHSLNALHSAFFRGYYSHLAIFFIVYAVLWLFLTRFSEDE